MGKVAILLIVALFTASAQCVAACGVLPCNDLSEHHKPVPAEDCHHKAPPADDHHDKSTCEHQVFLSEAGPQASSFTFDAAVLYAMAVNVVECAPETIVLLDPASDRSPPPLSDLSAKTILRV